MNILASRKKQIFGNHISQTTIATSNYTMSGPMDSDKFVFWVQRITDDQYHRSQDADDFIKRCEEKGLVISERDEFIAVYWDGKKRQINHQPPNTAYKFVNISPDSFQSPATLQRNPKANWGF